MHFLTADTIIKGERRKRNEHHIVIWPDTAIGLGSWPIAKAGIGQVTGIRIATTGRYYCTNWI